MSGVLAFQMDGVFIGATWSRDMRNMMLLSFAAYLLALYVLAPSFGNHGLWASLHVFLLVRGASLLSRLSVRLRADLPVRCRDQSIGLSAQRSTLLSRRLADARNLLAAANVGKAAHDAAGSDGPW